MTRYAAPMVASQPQYQPQYAPQFAAPARILGEGLARGGLMYSEGGGQIAELQSAVAQLQQSSAVRGGPVYRADYDRGMGMYTDPGDVSKGGILQSDVGTLIAAAPVGTKVTVEVGGENLSRLTETLWVFCAVALRDELASLEEASKCLVTADLTGSRINTLYKTPLDVLSPTLMGEIIAIPVRRRVPGDSTVSFTVEVLTALTTTAPSSFVFRLYAGSDELWAHAIR